MNDDIKKIILLVEDETITALTEKAELEKFGFKVLTAYSGEEAIDSFNNTIDLILMDIDLGSGIDGTETAEIILKNNDVPIVFLSSHTEPAIVEKTEKITSYGYVVKNTGKTVLNASIKMAFRLFEEKQNVKNHQQELSASNEELEATNEELEATNEELEASYEQLTQTNEELSAAYEELEKSQQEIIKREMKLQESEEKHRALIENLSEMILILDKDGVNLWNSPAVRQYGMEPEDAIGINARDYTHPDDKERVDRILKEAVDNPGKLFTLKGLKAISDSGQFIYLDDTFIYLPDTPGINGIVVTCHNVTEQKNAEDELGFTYKELSDIKTLMDAVFEQSPIPMAVAQTSNAILLVVNPACRENLGIGTDLIGKSLIDTELEWKTFTPDGKEITPENLPLSRAIQGETISKELLRVVRKDGSSRWVEVTATPIFNKQGNQIAAQIAFPDITKRKEAEEKIQHLSQFRETIIDNANVWLNVLDNEGNVIIWNKAAEQISGYSKDEVIGRSDIWEWFYPDVNYRNEIIKHVTSIIEGEMVENLETTITCKDGNTITMSWHSRNILDEKKNSIGSIALGLDITESKVAEKLLQNEKLLTEEYVNSLPGLFYVFDEDRFVTWNKQFELVSGYSSDELSKMYVTDFFLGPDKTLVDKKMKQVFTEGVADVEVDLVTKHGIQIPYLFNGLRKEFNGKPHLVGLGLDISDRKKTEIALEKAFQENKNLLRELQHRAKNSFSLISSMINLANNSSDFSEVKSTLSKIGSRVNAVTEMYDLLYITDSVSNVQLDDYLTRITSSIHGITVNITIKNNFDSIIIPVKTAIPVGIIIVELLTNSIKHAFPDNLSGTIIFSLKKKNNSAVLEIKDDGIGLPKGFDVSTIDSMGLKLVQNLIIQIEGRFNIKGNNGTTSIIEFPIEKNNENE